MSQLHRLSASDRGALLGNSLAEPELIDLRRIDHLLPWERASLRTMKWRGSVTWLERRGRHLYARPVLLLAHLRGLGLAAKAAEIESLLRKESSR